MWLSHCQVSAPTLYFPLTAPRSNALPILPPTWFRGDSQRCSFASRHVLRFSHSAGRARKALLTSHGGPALEMTRSLPFYTHFKRKGGSKQIMFGTYSIIKEYTHTMFALVLSTGFSYAGPNGYHPRTAKYLVNLARVQNHKTHGAYL